MLSILNFVISLLFLFTVFSLLTSWFIEFYTRLVNERGKFLWKRLEILFGKGQKLLNSVKKSPFIVHLSKNEIPEYVPRELFAKALISAIINSDSQGSTFQKIKDKIEQMNTSEDFNNLLSKLISELSEEGKNTIQDLEIKIADWFGYYEERLTQWYKDHLRLFLFFSGLILAVAANIDAVSLVQRLWNDKELAEAMAYQGEVAASQSLDSLRNEISKQTLGQLKDGGLPIGWPDDLKKWWLKAIGFLITAFAVSFGAPFWYEMLQKMVGLKSMIPISGIHPKPD